ncbi:MAG: DUF4920 domain-containing protein [Ignavibacteria bacterium]|nr:DUF4920 domain-containing protein [Ignavibacteria bacterium]MBK6419038.1 DUF4920 domain-containing protein [Ignavibacteria bacterium]MBK7033979.1 DUF4920 domain-containing protein [Ignavibacteria bacterium]MBK7411942.1 DUF4920 domain-containing protein [Ignavibacteria bacterium]MBK7576085.1 DUF4920 domain-containing protein [Ignavibacteria bacterium]
MVFLVRLRICKFVIDLYTTSRPLMKTFFSVLIACVVMAFTLQDPAPAKKGQEYGAGVKASTVLSLSRAVTEKKFNAPIAVTAMVKEVCQKKGCWMILADGTTKVRVTFKDYSFFMPKDLAGKRIVAEGMLKEDVLSEADARHYAEDAGKSKKEIEKIKGDQQELTFEATGVRVR